MSTPSPVTENTVPAPGVQLFVASTLYGAATIAAALDAGLYGPRAHSRRILLITTNTPIPETGTPLDRMPGFTPLRGRFDEIRDWNDVIQPQHPAAWAPQPEDVPIWERLLRDSWGLGDAPIHLTAESLQSSPARAIVDIFSSASLDVYADGLMSYGPTRVRLPGGIGRRVKRLLHLDLVPGLRPLLLGEFGVDPLAVPDETFLSVLGELAEQDATVLGDTLPSGKAPALLLGQYLSALNILTPAEEDELHIRMLKGAVAAGHREIVFKPHPSAPPRGDEKLGKAAVELGAELTVLDAPVLAETVFARLKPGLVVGCFSTALLTASTYFGIPVARAGTELLLQRLKPYQNSNRIPATVVDAALPDIESSGYRTAPLSLPPEKVAAIGELITAVGYCMQNLSRPDLRDAAIAYLDALPNKDIPRHFRRKRLTALGLPGGVQGKTVIPRNRFTKGAARVARNIVKRTQPPTTGADGRPEPF